MSYINTYSIKGQVKTCPLKNNTNKKRIISSLCLHMELHKLKEDYLRTNDPTEYFFVVKYIGTWDLWESMCNDIAYKPIIESWRRELEAKIKSDAMSRILEAARGETRDALQANKFLLDSPWIKEANGRGRPSKQEGSLGSE
jgi:hypothetical protein